MTRWRGRPEAVDNAGTLKNGERRLIVHALARWEGNRTRAADELGITRRTLFNKIREYGLDQTRERGSGGSTAGDG